MSGAEKEDILDTDDSNHNEIQVSPTPVADIEEVLKTYTQIIEKPFNELLNTIEDKP